MLSLSDHVLLCFCCMLLVFCWYFRERSCTQKLCSEKNYVTQSCSEVTTRNHSGMGSQLCCGCGASTVLMVDMFCILHFIPPYLTETCVCKPLFCRGGMNLVKERFEAMCVC